MAFPVGISLVLGNSRYDSHVRRLRVSLSLLPGVNRAVAVMPSTVPFSASPGENAQIGLTAGDTTETVLTGTIKAVERTLTAVAVTVSDGSADLHACRPAATYEGQNSGQILQALAGDAGLSTGRIDANLDLAAYVAEQSRTAGEHAALLARLSGCLAFVSSGNELSAPKISDSADCALRYGRDILVYQVQERKKDGPDLGAIGNGPAGSGSAPDALRQTVASLPSNAQPPGAKMRWLPHAFLRTPSAASDAGDALNDEAGRGLSRAEGHCLLNPELRLGSILEISDAPDGLSPGPWIVTGIVHEVRPSGRSRTIFRGKSAGGGGLGGLAGGLLSS